jgi:hypothetical protein
LGRAFKILKTNTDDAFEGASAEEIQAERADLDDRISAMVAHIDAPKKKINYDGKALASNKYFALSFDKCLRGSLNLGLSYFEPMNKKLLLQKGEVLQLADIPLDRRHEGSSTSEAIAVKAGSAEPPRVLVPRQVAADGSLWRPALHKSQDQGSIGWVASLWIDNCLQLRGTTFEDLSHRYYGNDFKDAFKAAGVWINVCERAVLYNASTAPWQGHGYFSMLQECSQDVGRKTFWRSNASTRSGL